MISLVKIIIFLERKTMAINTVTVTAIEQISELLWSQEHDARIDRHRANCLFRGLPNADFRLATSLHRNCFGKEKDVEEPLLRNFTKYAMIEDDSLQDSIWRQLVIGQHHGLPTRLLDWTYSVLAALHFATSGEDLGSMDKHDGVIWQIDILEMNSTLPTNYRNLLKEKKAYLMTIEMLDELIKEDGYNAINRYDTDLKRSGMLLLEPPSIDQRIISQYSYFSVIPSGMENPKDDLGIEQYLEKTVKTKKYIIDKNLKWRIRDMLDQMNVNERTVYPGIDGLAAWLKRHFYVKRI